MTEAPAEVQAVVKQMEPGGGVTRVERVTRDTVVTYEVSVRTHGKTRNLVLTPNGTPAAP
jgi:hypothetical protein